MAKRIDYSKWDRIEVSDDEDDTHPNIDTPSLFRWRHQARVEKMAADEQAVAELASQKKELEQKMETVKTQSDIEKSKTTNKERELLKKERQDLMMKEIELQKELNTRPLNVDTLSSDGFSKTIINKLKPKSKVEKTEDELQSEYSAFIKNSKKKVKEFGMMSKFDASKRFLMDNPELVCEHTANFLVIYCIDLEVEEKHALMAQVAHQTIIMQYILELSKTLECDPRATVPSFFSKMAVADDQYLNSFQDELDSFKKRVQGRAQARIDKAIKEYEEEERQKRIGPGGLDPADVFESLPAEMRDCFEKKDIPMLQEFIKTLSLEDARYHMKRCVESGLWVPGPDDDINIVCDEVSEQVEKLDDVPEYETDGLRNRHTGAHPPREEK